MDRFVLDGSLLTAGTTTKGTMIAPVISTSPIAPTMTDERRIAMALPLESERARDLVVSCFTPSAIADCDLRRVRYPARLGAAGRCVPLQPLDRGSVM